jgi:hypothetical protein
MITPSRGTVHDTVEAVHHAAVAVVGFTIGSIREGYSRVRHAVRHEQRRTGEGSYPEELTEKQVAYIYQLAEDRRRKREQKLQPLKGLHPQG